MDDPFRKLFAERDRRIQEHASLRASPAWRTHEAYLERLFRDFLLGSTAGWWASSRSRGGIDNSLVLRHTDDLIQSAIAIQSATIEGLHNPARREKRYALESLVQFLYVDQARPNATFEERLSFYKSDGERSDIDKLDEINLSMLTNGAASQLKGAIKSDYRRLCSYVHPSVDQLRQHLANAKRGAFLGFETADLFAKMNREIFRFFDILLVLFLHGIGPDSTGDVFINILDGEPKWKFHKGRFARILSEHFDYKSERQKAKGPSGSDSGA